MLYLDNLLILYVPLRLLFCDGMIGMLDTILGLSFSLVSSFILLISVYDMILDSWLVVINRFK